LRAHGSDIAFARRRRDARFGGVRAQRVAEQHDEAGND
jgi:hypothetical protein